MSIPYSYNFCLLINKNSDQIIVEMHQYGGAGIFPELLIPVLNDVFNISGEQFITNSPYITESLGLTWNKKSPKITASIVSGHIFLSAAESFIKELDVKGVEIEVLIGVINGICSSKNDLHILYVCT